MNARVQTFFDDSPSDKDEEINLVMAMYADTMANKKPNWGGSVPGHLVLRRNKQDGHAKLLVTTLVRIWYMVQRRLGEDSECQ